MGGIFQGSAGTYGNLKPLQIIEIEHYKIHKGNHYNVNDYDISPLGAGATVEFVMTTPDTATQVHLKFETFSSTGATIELYEGTSGVTGGTNITPRNNNRQSTNKSSVTLIKDPTIAVDGVRASGFLAGANRNGGSSEINTELILDRNQSYLVRITSLASSNNISWSAIWYELDMLN